MNKTGKTSTQVSLRSAKVTSGSNLGQFQVDFKLILGEFQVGEFQVISGHLGYGLNPKMIKHKEKSYPFLMIK